MERLSLLLALLVGLSGVCPAAASDDARQRAADLVDSLQSKFQDQTILASTCADGLQACVDSLPDWATLDGEAGSFTVSSLKLKSRMRLRNFHFVKWAGDQNMTSPVTLDGKQSPQSDVVIENVTVDGRRESEFAIETPSAEDGGRHCFRIVGRVSNVALLNVEGNFCGSDGLQLGGQHATNSDQPEELPLQNIVVRDARFEWNRRVGVAFEGGHNLYFIDVRTNANGRALDYNADPSSGSYCAHVNRACFGTGVWTENDHGAAGGSFDSVYFVSLESRQNFTRGFYAYSNSGPQVENFRAKSNLMIADSSIDSGFRPIAGNPIAIQFSSASADGAGAVYRGITIENSRIDGTICGRSLESLRLIDVQGTRSFLGFLEYFDDIQVTGGERRGGFLSSLWLRPDGSPGAVIRY